MIDFPAFAHQKQMQSLEAVAHTRSGQIPQPNTEGALVFGLTSIPLRRATNPYQAAGLPLADLKADAQKLDQ